MLIKLPVVLTYLPLPCVWDRQYSESDMRQAKENVGITLITNTMLL